MVNDVADYNIDIKLESQIRKCIKDNQDKYPNFRLLLNKKRTIDRHNLAKIIDSLYHAREIIRENYIWETLKEELINPNLQFDGTNFPRIALSVPYMAEFYIGVKVNEDISSLIKRLKWSDRDIRLSRRAKKQFKSESLPETGASIPTDEDIVVVNTYQTQKSQTFYFGYTLSDKKKNFLYIKVFETIDNI